MKCTFVHTPTRSYEYTLPHMSLKRIKERPTATETAGDLKCTESTTSPVKTFMNSTCCCCFGIVLLLCNIKKETFKKNSKRLTVHRSVLEG